MPILVGTAGWADSDLIASGWYPPQARTPAGRLRHYAGLFPLAEADSPYYAIPNTAVVRGWAEHTPEGFVMDVKAYSLFTGHRTPVASLPPELRELAAGHAWIRGDGAPKELLDETWIRFHQAVEPLRAAGRLGLVVLQFPASCRPGPRGERMVTEALSRCAPLAAAVEFRHGSWLDPRDRDRALGLLREHGAALVCVDMPQEHPGAMPLLLAATADTALVRLHGRSAQWSGGDKRERYRHEYTAAELDDWARRARELSRLAGSVHVVCNNCCGGAAQRAAAGLLDRLSG
ncbi:DUF72 domain-containing protein [Actinocrinis puniceicyclus]|uniref:DUF72 domain-containing protein n=1 Tax=Actinocrinis puniceicyclus TaxID=977794 RepID=A0A8J8BC49_9ACTN|nr:DUF72 domain-containing protein [Actinocrinis puniceicyclus]MBS2963160.1 DUF72 domain-containing protein [Actinocrinis puniceicyclus]